ncbi:uncharacterized protein [Battus philenor]|uniref:uncharacterized protein n=1 Tax=Battus philenor TaxID=42288 RepID=UPI0035D04D94
MSLYTVVGLTLVFSRSMQVYADLTGKEACVAVFNGTAIDVECCDSEMLRDDTSKSSQCGPSSEEGEMTCDDFKCLLEEDGIIINDKISEDKAKEMFDQWEKDYPKEKAMVDRARRECLGGEYLKFPAEDDCEPLKFYSCLYAYAILECQSWKDDAECITMKENAQKCKKALGY